MTSRNRRRRWGLGRKPLNAQPATRIGLRSLALEQLEHRRVLATIVDTPLDVVDSMDGLTSLREAIDEANANPGVDLIQFDATVFTGEVADVIRLRLGQLVISDSVHIDGGMLDVVISGDADGNDVITPGTLVTNIAASNAQNRLGDNSARIFHVTAASGNEVKLTGLTVTGANSAGLGGGLYAPDSDLLIERSSISGNRARDAGGIVTSAGAVTITQSSVSGNISDYSAGGILTFSGSVTVSDSTFIGNNAGYDGGGILARSGSVSVTNSTFNGNSSVRYGGGIRAEFGSVAITNSTFSGNSGGQYGGGIASYSGQVTVTNSTFGGNTAFFDGGGVFAYVGSVAVTNSTFSENSSVRYGGGIHTVSGSVNVTHSTFSGNSSSTDGGGIHTFSGSVDVTHSTFSGNSSGRYGGGISCLCGAVTLKNSTLSSNSAGAEGGGIWTDDSTVLIESSTITGNSAANVGGGIALFADDYVDAERITIRNSIVAANVDNGTAPDVQAPGDPINDLLVEFSLIGDDTGSGLSLGTSNNNLVNIDAQLGPLADNGGPTQTHALLPGSPAINAGDPSFDPNSFTPALINDQRGAGFQRVVGGWIDLGAWERQVVLVDLADDESDDDFSVGDVSLREAIQLANATPGAGVIQFDATVFDGDAADVIRLNSQLPPITADLTLDASATTALVISGDVNGDDTPVAGTPLTDVSATAATELDDNVRLLEISDGSTTLIGLTLTGGQTTNDSAPGGAIQSTSTSELTISNSTISGNATTGHFASGGGIAAAGDVTLTDSIVSGNFTAGDDAPGGGIQTLTNVTLIGGTIHGNSTAGVESEGGGIFAVGNVTLIGSTASENTSGGLSSDGGGIYSGGMVHLEHSTVSGNSTTGGASLGGGILSTGDVTLVGSTIQGNSTATGFTYGGGITSLANATLVNSTVSGNVTLGFGSKGGGVFTVGGVTLTNATITNNSTASGAAEGGGVYSRNGIVNLTNSIVAGNTTISAGPDLFSFSPSVTASYSLIGSNEGTGLSQTQLPDAMGNLVGGAVGGRIDPQLGPLADNGGPTQTHRLLLSSPAISAGDPSFDINAFTPPLVNDQRGAGFPRIVGGRIDMGALERQPLLVDLATDENDGDFSVGDLSLREAIQLANEGPIDAIGFDSAVFNGELVDVIRLQLGPLVVSEAVHIAGGTLDVVVSGDASGDDLLVPGTYLTDIFASSAQTKLGDNSLGIFNVTAASSEQVKLTGLTVTGGNGAGITANDAQLVVEQSSISGNRADIGGGIYTLSGSVTVAQSSISGNSSTFFGGGIFTSTGSVTINDSAVSGNHSGADGGGLLTSYGVVTVTNSAVSGNGSLGTGGGIRTTSGSVTIEDSAVSSNSSGDDGGGIVTTSGAVTLLNSTVSSNSSSFRGGGIRTSVGTVRVTNSTVSGNRGLDGGGIWTDASIVLIDSSTFTDNTAASTGGGIGMVADNFSDAERLTIRNSIVAGNVDNGTAPDLQSPGDPMSDLVVAFSLIGDATGAGLDLGTSTNNLVNVDPQLGPLADNGGPTLTHGLLRGSPAINAGDPNFNPNSFTPPLVDDQRGSGFSRVSDGRIDVGAFERRVFLVDLAEDENDGDFSVGDLSLREAIQLANTTSGVNIIEFDATVFNGQATDVIRLDSQLPQITADVTIDATGTAELVVSGDVDGNDTLVAGTQLTDLAATALPALGDNVRLLEINAGSTTLIGLTLTGGRTTGDREYGGAIRFNSSGLLEVERSTISGNGTTGHYAFGGAIYALGGVTLTGSAVTRNHTLGQYACGGGLHLVSGDVEVTDSSISGNIAASSFANGGGICTYYGAVTIHRSTVSGNSSYDSGGGISSRGPLTVTDSTISDNGSGALGGGIASNSASVTIQNSTLSGNSSSFDGGGIWTYASSVLIENSTVTSNSAGYIGGGIGLFVVSPYCNYSCSEQLRIRNSVVAGNTDNGTAPDVVSPGDPANDLVVEFSLIGNDTGSGLNLGTSNSNLVNVDPQLGPLADNGGVTQTHALLIGSPATNAGDPSFDSGVFTPALLHDQRGIGFPRVSGTRIDMGAFERQRLVVDLATDENDGDFSVGDLSLREAIQLANAGPGNEITFDASVFNGEPSDVIRLQLGQLVITESVHIDAGMLDVVVSGDAHGDDVLVAGTFVTDIAASDAQNKVGDNSGRIFDVTAPSGDEVRLTGVTVTGGHLVAAGAGINVDAATLIIERSSISGNRANGIGGGISSSTGSVTISNSTISGNITGFDGGGVYAFAGPVNVTNSSVVGNSSGSSGGGILASSGAVMVNNSTINENRSGAGGGGIRALSGAVMVTASTINGNSSVTSGGGIRVALGGITVANSTISGNSSGTLAGGGGIYAASGPIDVISSTISGNSSGAGGGIGLGFGSLTVTNSTISHNNSVDAGGGIWIFDSAVLIENSTVTGNTAGMTGGGLGTFAGGDRERLTIRNSIVAGNMDNGTAPDLQAVTDPVNDLVVEFSLIGDDTGSGLDLGTSNNNQLNVDPQLGPLADNGGPTLTHLLLPGSPAINAGDPGFDPDAFEPSLTNDQRSAGFDRVSGNRIDIGAFERQHFLVDTALDENDGDFSVGDLSLREAIELANAGPGAEITFDAAVFDGEANDVIRLQLGELTIAVGVHINGGTLDVVVSGDINGDDLLMPDTFVTDITASSAQNKLVDNSGRIFDVIAPTGHEVKFTGLTVTGGSLGGFGPGITSYDANLAIEQSSVSGNLASIGGSIYARNGDIKVSGSTVNNNSGSGIVANFGSVTVTNSSVSHNSTAQDGGGILTLFGSLTITNSVVSGNSSGGRGGGISNVRGVLTVTGSTVSNNTAVGRGGGIESAIAPMTVTNSTVSGNSSGEEGGGISTANSLIAVSNSTVSGNSSGYDGGGIWTSSGSVVIADSTISQNHSGYDGGGIFTALGPITLRNSTLIGNSSAFSGGGVFTFTNAVSLINSTLSGNTSRNYGGAIWTNDATLLVEHSTITGNSSAVGGGISIYADDGSVYERLTIRNSIVASNSDNGTAPDVQAPGDPAHDLVVEFSLIGDDTGAGLNLGTSVGNLVNVDPLLGPLANNGGPTLTHALLPGSPAISAGNPSFDPNAFTPPLVNDQRGSGFARVSGSQIDMGAYELQRLSCDLNGDSDCDIDDIDAMIMEIAAGTNDPLFDLNADGLVDLADRDQWLADAGALNLPSGNAYLLGDSNLDGNVDGLDFIIWNNSKFQPTGRWSEGDWNADGTTDGVDFIIWNNNKFKSADDREPVVDRLFASLFGKDEDEGCR